MGVHIRTEGAATGPSAQGDFHYSEFGADETCQVVRPRDSGALFLPRRSVLRPGAAVQP